MKICTLLPSFSGFTKIVSSASPRFRFSMEDAGVIRSLPSLVQPWVLEIRGQFGADVFHVRLTLKIKLLIGPSVASPPFTWPSAYWKSSALIWPIWSSLVDAFAAGHDTC